MLTKANRKKPSTRFTKKSNKAKSISIKVGKGDKAKTVMVKIDGKMAMAVLPASRHIDMGQLKKAADAESVELASEQEFRDMFPGCETGAMPPFGNLYDMPVYVAASLAEDEMIAFNAGSHTELIRMAYADFERLVQPWIVKFSETG